MDPRRKELVVERIARLRQQRERLERDWKNIPKLAFGWIVVPPVYLLWGMAPAITMFLFVPCLIGTAMYFIGVRLGENQAFIDEAVRSVEREDAEAENAGDVPASSSAPG